MLVIVLSFGWSTMFETIIFYFLYFSAARLLLPLVWESSLWWDFLTKSFWKFFNQIFLKRFLTKYFWKQISSKIWLPNLADDCFPQRFDYQIFLEIYFPRDIFTESFWEWISSRFSIKSFWERISPKIFNRIYLKIDFHKSEEDFAMFPQSRGLLNFSPPDWHLPLPSRGQQDWVQHQQGLQGSLHRVQVRMEKMDYKEKVTFKHPDIFSGQTTPVSLASRRSGWKEEHHQWHQPGHDCSQPCQ